MSASASSVGGKETQLQTEEAEPPEMHTYTKYQLRDGKNSSLHKAKDCVCEGLSLQLWDMPEKMTLLRWSSQFVLWIAQNCSQDGFISNGNSVSHTLLFFFKKTMTDFLRYDCMCAYTEKSFKKMVGCMAD